MSKQINKKELQQFWEMRPEFIPSLSSPRLYLDCQVNDDTFIQIWASQDRVCFHEPIHLKMRVVQGWNKLVDENVYVDSAVEANTEVLRFLFVNGSSFELSLIKNVDLNTCR